jgi:hypothetical protein
LPGDARRSPVRRFAGPSGRGTGAWETQRIDLDTLVEASDLFTPADIEFAARKGSQGALEIAVYGDLEQQPQVGGPTTADYVAALSETRPTRHTRRDRHLSALGRRRGYASPGAAWAMLSRSPISGST